MRLRVEHPDILFSYGGNVLLALLHEGALGCRYVYSRDSRHVSVVKLVV